MQERLIDNSYADQLAARADAVRDRLRQATRELHTRAESSGIVCELLGGRASIDAYALYLRNLLPAYRALESDAGQADPGTPLAELRDPALRRATAIEADLTVLAGPHWGTRLRLVPAADAYEAIVARAHDDEVGWTAHAYVRYLGDLSGGQIMASLLQRTLGVPSHALAFYRFRNAAQLRIRFGRALASVASDEHRLERLIHGARVAFELNIRLSEEVGRADGVTPRI